MKFLSHILIISLFFVTSVKSEQLKAFEFTSEEFAKLKKRKVHYLSGSFLQKLSLLLKSILPDTLFEKIIMNHYKV